MSNNTTLDALNDSKMKKATLLTEIDSTQHCPGCLCTPKRLYCDACFKSRRPLPPERCRRFFYAGVYTIIVAVVTASVSRLFHEKCDSKEEPFFLTRWVSEIVNFYNDEL